MGYRAHRYYQCAYDGADGTVTLDGSPPVGWVVILSGGVTNYFHNAAHASLGAVAPYAPGLIETRYIFTDDFSGSEAQNNTGALPPGWLTITRNNTAYYFASQANANSWLAANP